MSTQERPVVPDIWQVRDHLDAHIRSWRKVRDHSRAGGQAQAPFCIHALQGLRLDLFGDVLPPDNPPETTDIATK